MSRIHIRPATHGDAAIIVQLVRDLAVYEHHPPSVVKLTEADVLRDGFGAGARFQVLLAELDDQIEGFALIYPNYSTWEARAGIHVEDLFVREAARSHGLGRRLLAAVAALAVERGAPRVDLHVLHWNPARAFYQRIGLTHQEAWLPYRLAGAALAKLAAEHDG